jgi:glycine hydroxymethyltransferase
MKEAEMVELSNLICDVLDDINNEASLAAVKEKVVALCARFPVYA